MARDVVHCATVTICGAVSNYTFAILGGLLKLCTLLSSLFAEKLVAQSLYLFEPTRPGLQRQCLVDIEHKLPNRRCAQHAARISRMSVRAMCRSFFNL